MIVIGVLIGLAVLGLVIAAHVYAWRRLVRDTTRTTRARRVGTVLFLAGPFCVAGTITTRLLDPPFWLVRLLAWPGYLWLAVFLYLVLALAAADAVRCAARRIAREKSASTVSEQAKPPPPTAPVQAVLDRRQLVARAVATGAVGVAVATVGHGTWSVLRGPTVRRVTVPLRRLPRSADGFRIAVVSDIHLGPTLGRGFAERVVATVNDTGADLVAVVGDVVDGDVEDLARATAPLARLSARHGAFFVTGNHEYISGAGQWVDHFQDLGLLPLQNARVELPGFDLAGVNDEMGSRYDAGPDYERALGDRDPARAVVLMAHQPVQVHRAVEYGVALQLSGHTHGGQLWPGNLVAGLANPTVAGLERYGDTQLYVTRGAGAWGPPTRVGAPSDVTVIELRSRDA